MLTEAAVRSAHPRARAYKLWDGEGLHLVVAPNGRRSWLWRSRAGGRERLITLGAWPELPLKAARARRDELRETALTFGASNEGAKRDTFEQVARAWHAHQAAERWSPVHAHDVLASLERDVFPALGARPIGAIAAPELLAIVRAVEARGARETAGRLRQRLSAVFGYAEAEGLIGEGRDPAAKLGRAMAGAGLSRPQPALTNVHDCRALLAACDHLVGANELVRLTSRFLALTAVRLDAVRGMRWSELEDLDGEAPLWRVPAARMKLSRAKKGEARFDHLVPLSPQAVSVLRQAAMHNPMHNMHSKDADLHALVFPGPSGVAPIGEGAIRALYARTEFIGRHVPHGWRASFFTILHEDLGREWGGDIDQALAHSPKDKVRAAYDRAQLLDRRRALFVRWGELLGG